MKPFLLLATRADDAVAEAEYRAFVPFGRLSAAQLVRVRLEAAPLDEQLPRLDWADYSGVILGGSPFTSTDPLDQKSPAQVRVENELERLIGDVLVPWPVSSSSSRGPTEPRCSTCPAPRFPTRTPPRRRG